MLREQVIEFLQGMVAVSLREHEIALLRELERKPTVSLDELRLPLFASEPVVEGAARHYPPWMQPDAEEGTASSTRRPPCRWIASANPMSLAQRYSPDVTDVRVSSERIGRYQFHSERSTTSCPTTASLRMIAESPTTASITRSLRRTSTRS